VSHINKIKFDLILKKSGIYSENLQKEDWKILFTHLEKIDRDFSITN